MHRSLAFVCLASSPLLALVFGTLRTDLELTRYSLDRSPPVASTKVSRTFFSQETRQDERPEIRYPRSTPKFIQALDKSVMAPMRLAGERPVPMVEVSINGKGPFLFFLDTGAGTITVDSAFVKEMNLPTNGKTTISGPGGESGVAADIVRIDRLQIGELEVRDFEAAAFDRSSFSSGEKIVGSLGLAVFGDLPVKLDYGKKIIAIGGSGLSQNAEDNSLECDFSGPVPLFEIELAGATYNAAFDSGFAATLLVSETTAQTLSFLNPPKIIGRGRTVSGDVEFKGAELDGQLRVGNQVTTNPSLTIMPEILIDREICVLGHAWGRNMAVTYDAKNQRVLFEASVAEDSNPAEASSEYEGTYGARSIFVENGKLKYRRDGGPALELQSVARDRFKLVIPNGERVANPLPEVRFDRDEQNRIKGFSLMRGEDVEESVTRSKD